MNLGIFSSSKLLTVFIKENMTRGLYTELKGFQITRGKLWGKTFCLFEMDQQTNYNEDDLKQLTSEYRITEVISLDIGRGMVPLLQTGDVVISSDVLLWRGGETLPVLSGPVQADSKLVDQVLGVFEKHALEEVLPQNKTIVGSIFSYGNNEVKFEDDQFEAVHCWDRNGFYLGEYCEKVGIPWVLVRFINNGVLDNKKMDTSCKWEMAKKCFWIVKEMLEKKNKSKTVKMARKLT